MKKMRFAIKMENGNGRIYGICGEEVTYTSRPIKEDWLLFWQSGEKRLPKIDRISIINDDGYYDGDLINEAFASILI